MNVNPQTDRSPPRTFAKCVHGATTSFKRWFRIGLSALIAAWLSAVLHVEPALADGYRLDTGDILRISVYGEDAYPLEAAVDDIGTVTLPLLGEVKARGHTAGTLVAAIEREFRAREILREPFVQVAVQEYRPFFISGAVARPGAYPYKPRMSIRHALAIAGGFKAISVSDKAPALMIADLRSDQVAWLIEIFRHQVQLERLEAELNGREKFDLPTEIPPELSPQVVAEILASEENHMQVRRANFERQIQHLEELIAEVGRKAELIRLAKSNKEMVVSDQLSELEGARVLRGKGLMTNPALLAAERTYNNYRIELAQIEVQATTQQQELIGLKNEIDKLAAARRIEIISQIQDAQIATAKARNKVRFVSDQLAFVSTYGEHRSMAELQDVLRITIHRTSDEGSQLIIADEDTPVEADDIVDIAIVPDKAFYSPGVYPAAAVQD